MKCLVVEDDFAAQQLLAVLLSDYAECSMVSDGKAGVETFVMALNDEVPYDLIFLDIMMPRLGGHETLQRIRQIERERGIQGQDAVKVIVTTGLNDDEGRVMAFQEGCDAYLVKPIRRSSFFREMRKVGIVCGPCLRARASECILPDSVDAKS